MSATATYFFSITASAGPKNYASAVQDLVGHIKELPKAATTAFTFKTYRHNQFHNHGEGAY